MTKIFIAKLLDKHKNGHKIFMEEKTIRKEMENMKWGSRVLAFILSVMVIALTVLANLKWR